MVTAMNRLLPASTRFGVAALAGLIVQSLGVAAQTFEPLPPVVGGATSVAQYDDRGRDRWVPPSGQDSYGVERRARNGGGGGDDAYRPYDGGSTGDVYRPVAPDEGAGYGDGSVYNQGPPLRDPAPARRDDDGTYGEPYAPPDGRIESDERYRRLPPRAPYRDDQFADDRDAGSSTYTEGEILRAGHNFFGSVSKGLASVIAYAFQNAGRPNGYILGEDAGGAFVAGLRYGEGTLHTRRWGSQRVFWQGPSLGYDFGAEGSKTMVLVYNLDHPSQIFARFGGVQGSAYLVGGVSIQFQKRDNVALAPIRSGVGLRLGANVGYLKYTRQPTWNPF